MRISDWSSDVCSSDLLGSQRLSNRLQIFAGIIAFGNLADVLAQRLAVTQMGGAGERIDLAARIVDVIFAGHVISGEGQHIRQRIAHHRAPNVRSEEHTSELQSLMRISYAVFCLKKKIKYNRIINNHIERMINSRNVTI